MVNEAYFSVTGYVATQPRLGFTRTQVPTLQMRVGWTPRRRDQKTGDWADEPSSFATVMCYRKVAEHAAACLRKGDPIIVKGTLRTREFEDAAGGRRISVDVLADSIGHDLSRGISLFTRSRAQVSQTALQQYRQEHGLPPQADGEPGLVVRVRKIRQRQIRSGRGTWSRPTPSRRTWTGPTGRTTDRNDLDRTDLDRTDLERAQPGPSELETPEEELFDEDEAIEVLEGAEPVGAPS